MKIDSEIKNLITAAATQNPVLEQLCHYLKTKNSGVIEHLLALATVTEGETVGYEQYILRYSAWITLKMIGSKYQREILEANGLDMVLPKLSDISEEIKIMALSVCELLISDKTPISDSHMFVITKHLNNLVIPSLSVEGRIAASGILASIFEKCSENIRQLCLRPYFIPIAIELMNTPKRNIVACYLFFVLDVVKKSHEDTICFLIRSGYASKVLPFLLSEYKDIACTALEVTKRFLNRNIQIEYLAKNNKWIHHSTLEANCLFKDQCLNMMDIFCKTAPITLPEHNIDLLEILFCFLRLNNRKLGRQKIAATAIARIFEKMPLDHILPLINDSSTSMYTFIVYIARPKVIQICLLQAYISLLNRLNTEHKIHVAEILTRKGILKDLKVLSLDNNVELANIAYEVYAYYRGLFIPETA